PQGGASRSELSPGVSVVIFVFSSRRRHTRSKRDWSSDVCSSDLNTISRPGQIQGGRQSGRPAANHYNIVKFFDVLHILQLPHKEIGRASCRERVEGCVSGGR